MPTTQLSPAIKAQYFDTNGLPLAFGQIYTYTGGTSTPQSTYTDATGTATNTNPIILDASGRANIWLDIAFLYKFVVQNSLNVTQYTIDDISSNVNGPSVTSLIAGSGITISGATGDVIISTTAASAITEWVAGPTPTFLSSVTFSLTGDQTTLFNVGRRVKFSVSAGTVYGTILSSTYASVTTVTVIMDGIYVLDAGLSAVYYGMTSGTITSAPPAQFVNTTPTTTAAEFYPTFVSSDSPSALTQTLNVNSGITYNASTHTLSTTLFSGNAATQTVSDNTTKLATTQFVQEAKKVLVIRQITSTQTYTPVSTVREMWVMINGSTGGQGDYVFCCGVGGPGYSEKYFSDPYGFNGSYTCTIGAAGVGGLATGVGGTGGTTSFGTLGNVTPIMTVTGSTGSTWNVAGTGGVGSGGTFNATGGTGGAAPSSSGGGGGSGSRAGNGYAGGAGLNGGAPGGGGGTGGVGGTGTYSAGGAGGIAATTANAAAFILPTVLFECSGNVQIFSAGADGSISSSNAGAGASGAVGFSSIAPYTLLNHGTYANGGGVIPYPSGTGYGAAGQAAFITIIEQHY